jgi:hypothetical protein
MFHACVQRFDVTGNLKNFAKFFETKQGLNFPAAKIVVGLALKFWDSSILL